MQTNYQRTAFSLFSLLNPPNLLALGARHAPRTFSSIPLLLGLARSGGMACISSTNHEHTIGRQVIAANSFISSTESAALRGDTTPGSLFLP